MRISRLLCVIGLCLASTIASASGAAIVLYHHVATDTPPSTSLSPAQFRSHLEFIRDNAIDVIPLDELLKAIETGIELPEKTIAITFDDGYLSIFTEAFPMLTEFGFPFTVFISTGPIDRAQPNYMTWDQIRTMSDADVIIANHMVEHPYMLDRQPEQTDELWLLNLKEELLRAQLTINNETGQDHKLFAYPYGEYDDRIKQMVTELGFAGFAQNSGAVNETSDVAALPRYPLASIYANLETAKTKFLSKAFNVELLAPSSPVTSNYRASARLKFSPGEYSLGQIGCFYDGQAMELNWLDREAGIVEITPLQSASGRRWRYICTAPDPTGSRYFWYSVQLINPN